MANSTNDITEERGLRALMAVDYYADEFDLAHDPKPLDLTMANLFLSSADLADLLVSINVMRHQYRLTRLPAGAIRHGTSIRTVVGLLNK